VYVFFPDPWPKRRHSSRRLFSPLFLDALWARLEIGGVVQVATDHPDYFAEIRKRLSADARFREVPAMERTADEQTEFEQLFRGQGLSIGQCAFQSLPGPEAALPPLEIPPEMEPQNEGEAAEWDDEERRDRSESEVELP
jgi:tRNA (guanine-N7-)-methyltransferase